MASYVNTDGFQDSKYFARSWALLTRDKGWIKPVLALWIAGIVPILGPLGVTGYIAEWARLTAWGVSSAPKQSGVQIGACIKSGWRAFLVGFVWQLVWSAAVVVLLMLPVIDVVVPVLSRIAGIAFALIVRIAVLRATIYQDVSGGFRPGTIFQMVENDAAGLLRILGINLIGGAIIVTIATLVIGIAAIPTSMNFISSGLRLESLYLSDGTINEQFLIQLLTWIASLIPTILTVCFILSFFANILEMIVMTALGLWMRQFNVPAWGSNDDPLPGQIPPANQYYAPSAYAQPPYTQQAPTGQQVPYAYGDTDYGQNTHGGVGETRQGPNQGQ